MSGLGVKLGRRRGEQSIQASKNVFSPQTPPEYRHDPPLCSNCLMDKRGSGMDMMDSFAAHMPTPSHPLAHRSLAFGLTRFACQTAD